MRYLVRAAIALSLMVPAMATAQEPGTVDAGVFGRYSIMDKNVSSDAAMSLGGRFGIFAAKNLAVELEYATGATMGDPKTDLFPTYVRVAYFHTYANKWQAIIGGGWVHDRTRPGQVGAAFNDDGIHFLLGGQRPIGERMALRMDAVVDYLSSPIGETPTNNISNINIHLQAGLNWRFAPASAEPASASAADSDRDGVPDAVDACPNTPAGEYVDGRGCIPAKDSDNDGVFDANDRCPNTPAGVTVDGSGCPPDTDKDGVIDVDDRCPNTPAGTRVNAQGCPLDSDGDGVDDANDRCPNTPAGVRVDATGCAPDADGDGVPDAVDACANTPRGATVDARGCVPVFTAGATNIVLEGVTFATGSARLAGTSSQVLDRVAESLVANPEITLEVQGHTDNTGSLAGNNRISQQRADAVRTYLISKGVAANRLTAKGYGPTQPKAPNTTAEGRAENRRVELKRTN
jgi:outer membrane protein OmpA-like peptidoglycan-associated protein